MFKSSQHRRFQRLAVAAITALAAASTVSVAAGATPTMRPRDPQLDRPTNTRLFVIRYTSHTGRTRLAYVLVPRSYGPGSPRPLPLVISPHGRGTSGRANAKLWGDLPGIGGFAVVNPDGEGDRLDAYSWGAPGQIDDLAKMPAFVHASLPW